MNMKILTIVYSIGPGGTERAAVNYSIAYKKYNCDSRIWVLGEGLERKPLLDKEGVITYLDCYGGNHESNLNELLAWQPQIIHVHQFDERLSLIFKKFKLIGSKIVETNVFSRPRYSKDYELVDVSFQLAYWGVWKYLRWMRNEPRRPICLRVPYLISNTAFFQASTVDKLDLKEKLGIPVNAFIAGRVGQPLTSKWDRSIFKVIDELISKDDNIYFVLVGMPKEFKSDYEKLPSKIKLNLKIIDPVSDDKLLACLYSIFDVFVHISKIGESFGYVLIESMACGCPVVTLCTPFKDNAQFEVVGDGMNVNRVVLRSQISKSILNIKTSKDKPSPDFLRNKVLQQYSDDKQMSHILDVYGKLINENHIALKNFEYSDFQNARLIVSKQMKSYGIFQFLSRGILEILQLPFFMKLRIILK